MEAGDFQERGLDAEPRSGAVHDFPDSILEVVVAGTVNSLEGWLEWPAITPFILLPPSIALFRKTNGTRISPLFHHPSVHVVNLEPVMSLQYDGIQPPPFLSSLSNEA